MCYRRWRSARCIQRGFFAHRRCKYFWRLFLVRRWLPTCENPAPCPSPRPEQLLQFEQVTALLLPALDANVPDRIAEAMKQKQRHQPPLQCRINIRLRISEPLEQASDAARQPCGHERAWTKQVVFAPSRHHVAEVDKP